MAGEPADRLGSPVKRVTFCPLACSPTMAPEVYDSAARGTYRSDLLALWRARRLIRLLARNNFLLRYHRSVLGVGWSLLNPLLQMLVYYVVFSHIFRFHTGRAPYVAYVLSGLVIANLVTNVINAVTASAATNAALITRLRIPAEVFGLGQTGELLASALISFVPLLVIVLIVGPGLAVTDLIVIAILLLTAVLATGIGLALAPLATLFRDTIQITAILLTFLTYLAPVFYPFSIVPERYQIIEKINPIFWYLDATRAALFDGRAGPLRDWLAMVAWSVGAWIFGTFVFSRKRIAMLTALA